MKVLDVFHLSASVVALVHLDVPKAHENHENIERREKRRNKNTRPNNVRPTMHADSCYKQETLRTSPLAKPYRSHWSMALCNHFPHACTFLEVPCPNSSNLWTMPTQAQQNRIRVVNDRCVDGFLIAHRVWGLQGLPNAVQKHTDHFCVVAGMAYRFHSWHF